MFAQTIQISSISPDQFAELIEQRSYQGTLRALQDHTPPTHPDLPDYLTRRQVAELLQISLVTLHDWSKDNEDRKAVLYPLKVNGRVRYSRDEVVKAMKEVKKYAVKH